MIVLIWFEFFLLLFNPSCKILIYLRLMFVFIVNTINLVIVISKCWYFVIKSWVLFMLLIILWIIILLIILQIRWFWHIRIISICINIFNLQRTGWNRSITPYIWYIMSNILVLSLFLYIWCHLCIGFWSLLIIIPHCN